MEETGAPLPGASVIVLLLDRSPLSRGMRPVGRAYTDRVGSYTVGNLVAGEYVVCAQALGSDLLKTCDWGVIPEVVKLTAGQSIKTADRSIARGRRVEIEVNDSGGHLDRSDALMWPGWAQWSH